MPAIYSIGKFKIFAVVAKVLQNTQNLVISCVVVWQRMATKCTKIYYARAQLLFCSLNLLLDDVLLWGLTHLVYFSFSLVLVLWERLIEYKTHLNCHILAKKPHGNQRNTHLKQGKFIFTHIPSYF